MAGGPAGKDFPQLEVVNRDSYEGIDEQIRDAEIIIGMVATASAIGLGTQFTVDSFSRRGGTPAFVSGAG